MTFITRTLAMMMALITAFNVSAVENADMRAMKRDSLPPYVIVVGDKSDPSIHHLADSAFNSRAGKVIFKVNRTELDRRASFLQELDQRVIPLAKEQNLCLVGLDIRGAASPEGPYDNNVRLSRGRAQALIDHLRTRLDSMAMGDIRTTTVAEDYPFLLWILEQDNDPAAPRVREIIESCGASNPAEIKKALQKADGGTLWRRLLKQYYPDLRAARVILYFESMRRDIVKVELTPPDLTADLRVVEMRELEKPYYPINPQPLTIERPHMLSVSSNLLADAFYMPNYGWAPMPNIGVEFYPRNGKMTYKAQFLFPYYHLWSKQKFFQIRDYHLEVRRYFNPGVNHTGLYLGAYVNAAKYGIGLSAKKGWQGEGFGGALKAGFILPIGSGRWRLEFHAAAGVFVTRYDPYVYGNPITGEVDGDYYYDWTGGFSSFRRRNHQFNWFGPTEVGITLSYDLLYWRVHKKGVSTRRKEVVLP